MTDTPTIHDEPTEVPILDKSLEGNVIEELVPASQRRPRHERGETPLLEVKGLRTSFTTRDGLRPGGRRHRLHASTAARSWASSASPAAARA